MYDFLIIKINLFLIQEVCRFTQNLMSVFMDGLKKAFQAAKFTLSLSVEIYMKIYKQCALFPASSTCEGVPAGI